MALCRLREKDRSGRRHDLFFEDDDLMLLVTGVAEGSLRITRDRRPRLSPAADLAKFR